MTVKERNKQAAARKRKAKAWAEELLNAVMAVSHRSADFAIAMRDGTAEEKEEAARRRDVAIFAAIDLYERIG